MNTPETLKRLTCNDITPDLPEDLVFALAEDRETIKDHTVYFLTFSDHLGFSCLVYKSGRIMEHAGGHAIHYRGKTPEALREIYRKHLRARLFTEEELTAPLADYPDYVARLNYLRNDYGCQRERVSIFFRRACVAGSKAEQEETARIEALAAGKVYDPVSFSFYADADFVRHHVRLFAAVAELLDARKDDYEFFLGAYRHEMLNHEYAINWQGNFDTLTAFGNLRFDSEHDDQDLTFYFDQLSLTDTQRRAYLAARNEILADQANY